MASQTTATHCVACISLESGGERWSGKGAIGSWCKLLLVGIYPLPLICLPNLLGSAQHCDCALGDGCPEWPDISAGFVS